LAGLATVGWIDALQGGQREGLTGTLWLAFFVAILVEQAVLDKATRGLFKLRVGELDERRRAVRDLGYRYGFRRRCCVAPTKGVLKGPTSVLDQIAAASSSNATATRRFAGASTASS
jgi:hypothetical protein